MIGRELGVFCFYGSGNDEKDTALFRTIVDPLYEDIGQSSAKIRDRSFKPVPSPAWLHVNLFYGL